MSSNIHGATSMEAGSQDGTSWLTINSDHGHVTVFMPLQVAEATARAFNMMTDAHRLATAINTGDSERVVA